tara:strand:- start:129 stop:995 length:867 start_codon:yes stop_codon:yes gene_type:complete
MPFLGTTPLQGFVSSVDKQSFTPNGILTSFTLNRPVANANDLEVFVGNVRQEPTAAYTAAGTTLDFGTGNAPPNGVNFYVIYKNQAQVTTTPPDGSISSEKLSTNIAISGNLDVSGNIDVGTIRSTNGTSAMTIDSSGRVLQSSVPAFRVGLTSDQEEDTSGQNINVVWNEGTTSESDNCFTQGGFSWNTGIVTVPVAGVYSFSILIRLDGIAGGNCFAKIVKNNDVTSNREFLSIEGHPSSTYQTVSGSGIFKCSASDTIKVTVQSEADSDFSVDAGGSIFSGHLIG